MSFERELQKTSGSVWYFQREPPYRMIGDVWPSLWAKSSPGNEEASFDNKCYERIA